MLGKQTGTKCNKLETVATAVEFLSIWWTTDTFEQQPPELEGMDSEDTNATFLLPMLQKHHEQEL